MFIEAAQCNGWAARGTNFSDAKRVLPTMVYTSAFKYPVQEQPVEQSSAERNRNIAYRLSNNLPRMLREFSRDFERRIWVELVARGHRDIRPSHSAVFANLGMGAVRVSELAERAQVTQQAMGKMLKELERMGYIARDVDSSDKRARDIRLTERGVQLAQDSMAVVDELMVYYRGKIGAENLLELEQRLRRAVGDLELEYLPESWQTTKDRTV